FHRYVIAVLLDHVEAGFPYISDVATYAPESCIFAQFINMLAMLLSFVIYIRYSQVNECLSNFSLQASLPKWNHWALIFGLTSTFGLSVVANFQETSVIVVHFIGALLCFGFGTAYFWTQVRRGAGGYVNFLSYRYRDYREPLLDEVAPLVVTTPPAARHVDETADALCPVQIHVHDPTTPSMETSRRRAGVKCEEKWGEEQSRNWIDLDENVLDGYMLIDDLCLESNVVPDEARELPYPKGVDEDEDNHESSSYADFRLEDSRPREDFDLSTTYPMANSHGNAYKELSDHSRYSELYSELAIKNFLEINREDMGNYSVANSHGDLSASSENRERMLRGNMEADQSAWDARHQQTSYEVANSHSNYRVFYDSQSQQNLLQGWPTDWMDRHVSENEIQKSDNPKNDDDQSAKSSRSEVRIDPTSEQACDIEQCLVQIEESLLNIEQNLLHVQDLDIPELRNLLYRSPSIERSLFEVQDLLYADAIVPVINKIKSSTENEEEEEDEEEEEEEEMWTDRQIIVKGDDNEDDAGAGAFNVSNEESDVATVDENNQSGSLSNQSNTDCTDGFSTVFREDAADSNYNEKPMNFIPNSLNKTLPRRIVLDGTKENIRLCSSQPDESTIDYNLNTTCADKKLFCRDKCHSRSNSLDENSTFSNLESSDKAAKSSLQNLLFESTNNNFVDLHGKARSEETLRTSQNPKANRKASNKKRWTIMDTRTEDFRKKLELISSNRRFGITNMNDQRKPRMSRESMTTRPREKSPNRTKRTASTDKIQDKDKELGKSSDKRKRKKLGNKSQGSSDDALVPSKLISLSLSLLLAALLQAVRCLTDLVEDAFRSVSYDRNGLLQ
ncbi:uncharacterized protein LOC108629801, partial [Ceratina calcarata]|uniref:Uncharacterized protein LOC108629801 n=1 Tax=Ceratina calcarata TaxID=156304 RepID=A0AAJ7S8N5_9HYME